MVCAFIPSVETGTASLTNAHSISHAMLWISKVDGFAWAGTCLLFVFWGLKHCTRQGRPQFVRFWESRWIKPISCHITNKDVYSKPTTSTINENDLGSIPRLEWTSRGGEKNSLIASCFSIPHKISKDANVRWSNCLPQNEVCTMYSFLQLRTRL